MEGLDLGLEVLESEVLPVEADGTVLIPDLAQDLDELVGAPVALLLRRVVALPALLGVATARDDVNPHPAAGDPFEAGERLRDLGRELEPRTVGDDRLDPLGVVGHELPQLERIG